MWHKFKKMFPAASLMVIVYYADSWILALPIIVVTAWLGGIAAFIVLVLPYLMFDYVLGRLTLRLVTAEEEARDYGRIMRLIRRWFNSFRDAVPGIKKRLSSKNKLRLRVAGFAVASYFGGAFITVPVMYLLGQRRLLRTLGVLSAAIYAVTFVAQYALGTSLVKEFMKYFFGWF